MEITAAQERVHETADCLNEIIAQRDQFSEQNRVYKLKIGNLVTKLEGLRKFFEKYGDETKRVR